jgi:predicted adenine nucleotide alpha hydrolase (AANH) superfamily ATPase
LEGFCISSFFFNPNIHPYTEYTNRLEALRDLCRQRQIALIERGGYGLRPFLACLNGETAFKARCKLCYETRLFETAKYAAENSFKYFSTTLLISPYQDHGLIISTARAAAARFGAEFLYRDFRELFRQGQAEARQAGSYMQKYCGCIFSEEERYRKTDA